MQQTLQQDRLKSCPPKLNELIERAYLVPPDAKLPVLGVKSGELSGGDKRQYLSALYHLESALKELPEAFQQYIYGRPIARTQFFLGFLPDLNQQEIYEALERYETFARLLRSFRRVISFNKSLLMSPDVPQARFLPVLGNTRLLRKDSGEIEVRMDEFSEALSPSGKESVDINRIRACEVCSRIFWAGRIDKWGCSPKCSNVIRVRKSRERKQEYAAVYKTRGRRRTQPA